MKRTSIGEILTEKEYQTCVELTKTCNSYEMCKEVARLVIGPKIDKINRILGQKNDPMYLAYAVVYSIEVKNQKEF